MRAKNILHFVVTRSGAIVLLLLVFEAAFRFGLWEPFAKPESSAGRTIAVKRSVNALGPEKLDFITMGDSRAVYGIDHERVNALAKSNGFTHANVATPSMHWMSAELLFRWVKSRAPNLKGVMIATNVTSFSYNGNGDYELAIATPLATIRDLNWMALHVPFDRSKLATYGSYSALFQYRLDIADFLHNPVARIKSVAREHTSPTQGAPLFQSHRVLSNICSTPTSSLKACSAATTSATNAGVVASCKSLAVEADNRPDFRDFNNLDKWPHLAVVKKIRQSQLRTLGLPRPALVVLMPVPKIWRDELLPKGGEAWAHSILQPLVDEGVIELVDYTHLLDSPNDAECNAFWDLYHQNAEGQQKLTDALLPVIDQYLYKSTGLANKQ
jgi:hypothetical protein